MKYILVALLTPVYLVIKLFKKIIETTYEIGEPFAEGINSIIEGLNLLLNNMYSFWAKFFKWNNGSDKQ